jgi:hypothetical protein
LLLPFVVFSLCGIERRLNTARIADIEEYANLIRKCERISLLMLQIFVTAVIIYRKWNCILLVVVVVFSIFKLTHQLLLMKGIVLNSTFDFSSRNSINRV